MTRNKKARSVVCEKLWGDRGDVGKLCKLPIYNRGAYNPGDGAQYFRSSSFIYYTVKTSLKAITLYASGSTFKEVSGTALKTVKVCLPTPEVVDRFTNTVDSILERQDVLEQENQQLTQLRDWRLPIL